jgi:MFS family permease
LRELLRHYKAAYSGLPKAAWMLAFVVFINRSGSIVLTFMTLYLTRELNYSVAAAGRMISLYGVGSLVGAYTGGWLSDVLGTKKVQLLSLVLSGIGFVTLGYARSPILIGFLLFIVAVVNESFRPANAAAVSQVSPPHLRVRGFALNRLAINLGVTFGPAVGGFLAMFDYRLLFWVNGITCSTAAIALWTFFRNRQFESPSFSLDSEAPVRSPWKDRIYLLFLLLMLNCGIMFVQLFNTWPLYMKDVYGLFENKIGLLLALNAFLVVLIEMPLIHRIQGNNPMKTVAVGAFLLFLGFAILPFGKGMLYGVFTVIIWSMGEMLIFPLSVGFVANRASDKNRGKYMGLYVVSFSLAFIIGPALGTGIYDAWGARTLWLSAGLMGVLVALGFLWVGRMLKKETVPPQEVEKVEQVN